MIVENIEGNKDRGRKRQSMGVIRRTVGDVYRADGSTWKCGVGNSLSTTNSSAEEVDEDVRGRLMCKNHKQLPAPTMR